MKQYQKPSVRILAVASKKGPRCTYHCIGSQ